MRERILFPALNLIARGNGFSNQRFQDYPCSRFASGPVLPPKGCLSALPCAVPELCLARIRLANLLEKSVKVASAQRTRLLEAISEHSSPGQCHGWLKLGAVVSEHRFYNVEIGFSGPHNMLPLRWAL